MNITFNISGTKYSIDLDGTTYTLSRIGINQAKDSKNFGEETTIQLGYFSQLKSALNKAVKDELGMQPDEVTLKEFLTRYEASNEAIMAQIGDK